MLSKIFSWKKQKNYIVIRNTLDWENAKIDQLRDEKIRQAACLWDEAFSISYCRCRAEIKKIAQSCLAKVHNAEIILYKNLKISALNDSDLLIFCDDDDWLHPNIFQTLRSQNAQAYSTAIWHDSVFGYFIRRDAKNNKFFEPWLAKPRIRRIDDDALYTPIKTNNYALSGRYLKKNQSIENVFEHLDAKQTLLALGAENILKINQPLSMVNRHPCSYVVLTFQLERKNLTADLVNFLGEFCAVALEENLEENFYWAKEYLSATKELFKTVYSSRKI